MAPGIEKDDRVSDPHQWLAEHGSALYRYAIGKVRRADVAEELVQETLLAAWRGRDRFRRESQVRSWHIGILKRKIIDWLRDQLRQRHLTPPRDDAWLDDQFTRRGKWKHPPSEWHADAPEADAMRNEFWAVTHQCLDKLPPRMRLAFVLWQLEGESTDAVSRELGLTAANVWVTLHRARLRLWRCLSVNWFGRSETELTGDPPCSRAAARSN